MLDLAEVIESLPQYPYSSIKTAFDRFFWDSRYAASTARKTWKEHLLSKVYRDLSRNVVMVEAEENEGANAHIFWRATNSLEVNNESESDESTNDAITDSIDQRFANIRRRRRARAR